MNVIRRRVSRTTASLRRFAAVRFAALLATRFGDDDLTGMAAEMAYSFLFALFPLLLLSAAMIGVLGGVLGRTDLLFEAMARIAPFLPTPVADLVRSAILDLITERAATIALVGSLLALWGAAGGVGALMKGLDRAYGVRPARPSWRRRAATAAAALVVPPLLLLLLALSVVGQGLAIWLGALAAADELALALTAVLGMPLAFLVFFGAMTLVYWTLPSVRQRYRDVLPGALVAAVGWSTVTFAFGVYIADADEYRVTYGIFGAAIAFLLWLYLVALVVLVGAEVNSVLSRDGRRAWDDGPVMPGGGRPVTMAAQEKQ
jgi:membrane protein